MTLSDAIVHVGTTAGVLWMCAAIWLEFIREETAHPGLVATLFLLGLSLSLSYSALGANNYVVQVAALAINLLLCFIPIVLVATERSIASGVSHDFGNVTIELVPRDD